MMGESDQTVVMQNIDSQEDQAAAEYVAAAVNHYQEVQTMEAQAQAAQAQQVPQQAIPVQVQVGAQPQEESSWFTTSNALKVGGGIVAGVAAKAMYDHFSSSGDSGSMAELSSAVADLF